MTKRLDHQPSPIKAADFQTWLDLVILGAEVVGRRSGYVKPGTEADAYFNRPLTPMQARIRRACEAVQTK
jgi:hypothetical protein